MFSNVPISSPILYPDEEICFFNGFAWSNDRGLIHQSTIPDVIPLEGNPKQWLGTQS